MKANTESVYKFLEKKGYNPNHEDDEVEMQEVKKMLIEFAEIIRDKQILISAVHAAHYTALQIRGAHGQLDNDLENHLNVCKVKIK